MGTSFNPEPATVEQCTVADAKPLRAFSRLSLVASFPKFKLENTNVNWVVIVTFAKYRFLGHASNLPKI